MKPLNQNKMKTEKQLTTVEWFVIELKKLNIEVTLEIEKKAVALFKQAKEMEKEQRIKAYQLGYDTGYKVCEMKFNGLFKSE